MRIAFSNFYASLNSSLFTEPNAPIGDDLLLPFNRLAEVARARGHEVGILGELPDPDAVVFIDAPDRERSTAARATGAKLYLITMENELIHPANFELAHHFDRVFTWHDALVAGDPTKYVKINYAQRFPSIAPLRERNTLCALIASAKGSDHPASLYPLREHAIEWFEKNARDDLHLWGPGWPTGLHSYRGVIPPGQKRTKLAEYRFAICFENASAPGYITEKIFDCFIAGTIPVYLGAPNVERWIPPECFIDARRFCVGGTASTSLRPGGFDFAALHKHLVTMLRTQKTEHQRAILDFIDGPRSYPFTIRCFVDTILGTVTA